MKGDFSGIAKKKKKPTAEEIEAFANEAKVDGKKSEPETKSELDPNARRGKRYKNKDGETVKLTGKVQEIPLNEYELKILQAAANSANLSLTTYIRSIAMNDANRILKA
jgi:hypothetical protein